MKRGVYQTIDNIDYDEEDEGQRETSSAHELGMNFGRQYVV